MVESSAAQAIPLPFATVLVANTERRGDASYRWKNYDRASSHGGGRQLVVQQTLGGAGVLEDGDGRRLVPVGWAMLFAHDDGSSYGYPPEATKPYQLRYVTFRPGALEPWWAQVRQEFGPVVRMAEGGVASEALAALTRDWRMRRARDRAHDSERLFGLLLALAREQQSAAQARDPIEHGQEVIAQGFRGALTLKEVAARCGVSREHFIRGFHARYGETPGGRLRRLRLAHADALLRGTSLPVQEVARACGFAHAITFIRAYRARHGRTPGMVRALP
jgi:AraC-like DNA-binding protein